MTGTGEALVGPASLLYRRDETSLYNHRMVGSGRCVDRASEAAIVPIEPEGQQNHGRGKGRYFIYVFVCREGRVIAFGY